MEQAIRKELEMLYNREMAARAKRDEAIEEIIAARNQQMVLQRLLQVGQQQKQPNQEQPKPKPKQSNKK